VFIRAERRRSHEPRFIKRGFEFPNEIPKSLAAIPRSIRAAQETREKGEFTQRATVAERKRINGDNKIEIRDFRFHTRLNRTCFTCRKGVARAGL